MIKIIKNRIHVPSGLTNYNNNYNGMLFFEDKQYLIITRSQLNIQNNNNTFNEEKQMFRYKTIFTFEEIDFDRAKAMYESENDLFIKNTLEINYAVNFKTEDKKNGNLEKYIVNPELKEIKTRRFIDFLILSKETNISSNPIKRSKI